MSTPAPPPDLAARRELIRRELERRRAGQAAAAPSAIRPRPTGSPPALSLAQRRLWFLDRMYPEGATYNATLTIRFDGPLRLDALRSAVDGIVARHEVLRTVLRAGPDGAPVAHLLDAGVGAPWELIELSAAPERLEPVLAEHARRSFDLGQDVFLRAVVVRLAPEAHVLLLVCHHIASDGGSRAVIFDELREAYDAAVTGRPARLPELSVQYGDWARWQQEQVDSPAFERTREFWRSELAGADVRLELPTDRPRGQGPSFRGGRLALEDPELGEQIRQLARSASATPFVLFSTLVGATLHALTGQDDLLLGCPSANREQPELAHLVGFFVDTMIVRVRLAGNPSMAELIGRVRESAMRSLAHPIPFEMLVDTLRVKRVPGVNPLFQVNMRMQGVAPPPPQLHGLTATRLRTDTGSARFELAFGFVDGPGPLRGYVEYDAALFDESTVVAIAEAFRTLARAAVADPGRPVEELCEQLRTGPLAARRAPAPAMPAPRAPARGIRGRRTSPAGGG